LIWTGVLLYGFKGVLHGTDICGFTLANSA